MVTELVQRLQAEKERVFKERLFKLVGQEIDIVAEINRRFPRLTKVINVSDHSEAYYWNDGTPEGQRIITFYYPELTIEQGPLPGLNYKFVYSVYYK